MVIALEFSIVAMHVMALSKLARDTVYGNAHEKVMDAADGERFDKGLLPLIANHEALFAVVCGLQNVMNNLGAQSDIMSEDEKSRIYCEFYNAESKKIGVWQGWANPVKPQKVFGIKEA